MPGGKGRLPKNGLKVKPFLILSLFGGQVRFLDRHCDFVVGERIDALVQDGYVGQHLVNQR